MNHDFYRGRRVFLTGHTGFKGAWLSLILQQLEAQLCGYALDPPSAPNLFNLLRIDEGMTSQYGDVRDLDALCRSLREFQPEIVIHLAAQALVRRSYRDPVDTYGTNVMGTVNLLEAVRRTGSVRATVIVTSDKCYENQEWIWGYRETDPLGGHDPYSSSKGCAEMVTAAFIRSYFSSVEPGGSGAAVASARAGNVIGGGDFGEDRLIPDMVRAFLRRETVRIRYPGSTRPWQHVLDPLAGYLLLAEKLWSDRSLYQGAWNFGPVESDVREVGWVVEALVSLWGDGALWEKDENIHPHEAGLLKLDCSKARGLLGWTPRLDIAEALLWTADWYRTFRDDPSSLREMSESQIRDYRCRLT